MTEKIEINSLEKELKRSGRNIKPEVLVSQSVENGFDQERFIIRCNGTFKRAFSKEIASITQKKHKNNTYLQIDISRSGICDHLPEGLFLPHPSASIQDIAGVVESYNQNKKIEEDTRLFFQPIENELFLQKVKLDQEECDLLEGLQSGLLNNYFKNFWELPQSISPSFTGTFIKLLPHAHKIAGNLPLMSHSLEQLLSEQVAITRYTTAGTVVSPAEQSLLGDCCLGVDAVAGKEFNEGDLVARVIIGPLSSSHITDYMEGGERHLLVKTFADFFLPAGMDMELLITTNKETITLENSREAVLGHTSIL